MRLFGARGSQVLGLLVRSGIAFFLCAAKLMRDSFWPPKSKIWAKNRKRAPLDPVQCCLYGCGALCCPCPLSRAGPRFRLWGTKPIKFLGLLPRKNQMVADDLCPSVSCPKTGRTGYLLNRSETRICNYIISFPYFGVNKQLSTYGNTEISVLFPNSHYKFHNKNKETTFRSFRRHLAWFRRRRINAEDRTAKVAAGRLSARGKVFFYFYLSYKIIY